MNVFAGQYTDYPQQPYQQEPAQSQPVSEEPKKSRKWEYVLTGVAAIVLVVVIYFVFLSGGKGNSDVTDKTGSAETAELGEGGNATFNGSTILVKTIGLNSAMIEVGQMPYAESRIIASGKDYDYGTILVKVNSVIYASDSKSRKINITVKDSSNLLKADQFQMQGNEVVLGEGESTTVSGITVKIGSISSDKVSLSVDSVTKEILDGGTYDFGSVKLVVESILYIDNPYDRKATILMTSSQSSSS